MGFMVEELRLIGVHLQEFINYFKQAPKSFILITLTLILRLSFASLANYAFNIPLIDLTTIRILHNFWYQGTQFTRTEICYHILPSVYSLFPTVAIVFTVISIYTFRPVSFISALSAIPSVFVRVFMTFLFNLILMFLYNVIFSVFFPALVHLMSLVNPIIFNDCSSVKLFFILYLPTNIYIAALWDMSIVVSVLEPIYGLEAMKKSNSLLRGKELIMMAMLFGYLQWILCMQIKELFHLLMLNSWTNNGMLINASLVGLFIVTLVLLVLVQLLLQRAYYVVSKTTYQNEQKDQNLLYVVRQLAPLNFNTEMQFLGMVVPD